MKLKFNFLFFIAFSLQSMAQIGMANHYPNLKPSHILDGNTENISVAFGMRILNSDYNGPLIRLRKTGDSNADAVDFYPDDTNKLDLVAVNTYGGTNTLHVVTWYDQSGLNRNAIQNNINRQPSFTPDATLSYFNGNDNNDILIIETSVQTLINNGKNGTVIGIFNATDNNNHTFGVRDNSDGNNRWLAHINWSDDFLYFDPGANGGGRTRSVNNLTYKNSWQSYTLSRRDNPLNVNIDEIVFRIDGVRINNIAANQNYADDNIITGDYYFGIGGTIENTITSGSPRANFSSSTTRFNEFIMYASGKDNIFIEKIEQNQISFWGL